MLEWLMISGVVISILLIVMCVTKRNFRKLSKVCLCLACGIVIILCITNIFEHTILSIVIMIIVFAVTYCLLIKGNSFEVYDDYDYYTMLNNDNINNVYDEYENVAEDKYNWVENIYFDEGKNDFRKTN